VVVLRGSDTLVLRSARTVPLKVHELRSEEKPSMAYDPPTPWKPSGPNEQPSTLPKDSSGQAINEDRRKRKAEEAEFEREHGRKMSKKDRKRQKPR
jgi:hypothetical protein